MVVAVKRVLPEHQANAATVRQTAEALEYLHRCGVIHCDIKPANVLIDNTWTARLSNFGLSTFALATMDMADLEKRANLGTEGFKAPEILFSGEATRQTDVFAFSCFIAANVSAPQAVMKLWRSNPLLPDEFKYIPSDLRELCTRCLSLYPEQRPAMAEVVAVLSVAQLP
ncbi:hypothetical protein FRC00_007194 [Tulasnella sp. 408]|nr:hypothetical protein FRC00_007194 [Tulasnella sp. 408]